MDKSDHLLLPALELSQSPGQKLYSFAVDGKLLHKFTTISRIKRVNGRDIAGYQRPEVQAHIAEIRTYLESANPLLPTSIVVAFDESVTFQSNSQLPQEPGSALPGVINIPLGNGVPGQHMPGWIVDGQQRAAAIREANIENFPIFVTGFIAASDKEQREQFILVNSPKPLRKDLIYELLPSTESQLPHALQRRRFSSSLLQRLNHDPDSPLNGMVRTPTNPGGVIKDNSILRMLENSLTDGALYSLRDPRMLESENGTDQMLSLLKAFWAAVAEVFKDAWGLSPRYSRLMHGAGIVSVGLLMDAIVENYRGDNELTTALFQKELTPLQEICHWTEGWWEFQDGQQREWNEIQNTSRDTHMLAMHLLMNYQMKS